MRIIRTSLMMIRTRFWVFGVAAGALVSTAVTLIIVTWEWLENPGGVFRNESTTNWPFIVDTAISWFVPLFIYTAIVASFARLAWSVFMSRRSDD